jgi:hypothetical protein
MRQPLVRQVAVVVRNRAPPFLDYLDRERPVKDLLVVPQSAAE